MLDPWQPPPIFEFLDKHFNKFIIVMIVLWVAMVSGVCYIAYLVAQALLKYLGS